MKVLIIRPDGRRLYSEIPDEHYEIHLQTLLNGPPVAENTFIDTTTGVAIPGWWRSDLKESGTIVLRQF